MVIGAQFWLSRTLGATGSAFHRSESGRSSLPGVQDAGLEQGEPGPPVHRALDQL